MKITAIIQCAELNFNVPEEEERMTYLLFFVYM